MVDSGSDLELCGVGVSSSGGKKLFAQSSCEQSPESLAQRLRREGDPRLRTPSPHSPEEPASPARNRKPREVWASPPRKRRSSRERSRHRYSSRDKAITISPARSRSRSRTPRRGSRDAGMSRRRRLCTVCGKELPAGTKVYRGVSSQCVTCGLDKRAEQRVMRENPQVYCFLL